MQLQELLKELDSLNLPKNQYVITSSAALAVRGIREANDLDIVVSAELGNTLKPKYPLIKEPFERIKLTDNIEALGPPSLFVDPKVVTPDKLLINPEVIAGHPYVNLETLRIFKALGTREKDVSDVRLIDDYLSKTNL